MLSTKHSELQTLCHRVWYILEKFANRSNLLLWLEIYTLLQQMKKKSQTLGRLAAETVNCSQALIKLFHPLSRWV